MGDVLQSSGAGIAFPSRRHEPVRLREARLVPAGAKHGNQHECVLLDFVPAEDGVPSQDAADERCDGKHPQRLADRAANQWRSMMIGRIAHLRSHFRLHSSVLRQQIECPLCREGGGIAGGYYQVDENSLYHVLRHVEPHQVAEQSITVRQADAVIDYLAGDGKRRANALLERSPGAHVEPPRELRRDRHERHRVLEDVLHGRGEPADQRRLCVENLLGEAAEHDAQQHANRPLVERQQQVVHFDELIPLGAREPLRNQIVRRFFDGRLEPVVIAEHQRRQSLPRSEPFLVVHEEEPALAVVQAIVESPRLRQWMLRVSSFEREHVADQPRRVHERHLGRPERLPEDRPQPPVALVDGLVEALPGARRQRERTAHGRRQVTRECVRRRNIAERQALAAARYRAVFARRFAELIAVVFMM